MFANIICHLGRFEQIALLVLLIRVASQLCRVDALLLPQCEGHALLSVSLRIWTQYESKISAHHFANAKWVLANLFYLLFYCHNS